MSEKEIYEKLTKIFRDVFYDDSITINAKTTANDIDGWDSLTHITLIGTIADEFDIEFDIATVVGLKNVNDMVKAIYENL